MKKYYFNETLINRHNTLCDYTTSEIECKTKQEAQQLFKGFKADARNYAQECGKSKKYIGVNISINEYDTESGEISILKSKEYYL